MFLMLEEIVVRKVTGKGNRKVTTVSKIAQKQRKTGRVS